MKTVGCLLLIFGLQALILGAEIPFYNLTFTRYNYTRGLVMELHLQQEDGGSWSVFMSPSGATVVKQGDPESVREIPETEATLSAETVGQYLLEGSSYNEASPEPQQAIAPPEKCAPPSGLGYHLEHPYGYFKYHEEAVNWSDATETCSREGTGLLTIGSLNELMFIKLMLTSKDNNGWYWTETEDTDYSRTLTSVSSLFNDDTPQKCKVFYMDVTVQGHFGCKVKLNEAALGYELVRGMGYYKYHSSAVTWSEARQTCEAEGTHLLVISSESEDLLVRLLLAKKKDLDWNWVGFSGEDNLVTVTGESLYERWFEGQPDYQNRWKHQCDHCGLFRYSSETSSGMGVTMCDDKYTFICEQELFRK